MTVLKKLGMMGLTLGTVLLMIPFMIIMISMPTILLMAVLISLDNLGYITADWNVYANMAAVREALHYVRV